MNNTLLKILEMERTKGRPRNNSPRRVFTSRIVSDIILLHWPLGGRVAKMKFGMPLFSDSVHICNQVKMSQKHRHNSYWETFNKCSEVSISAARLGRVVGNLRIPIYRAICICIPTSVLKNARNKLLSCLNSRITLLICVVSAAYPLLFVKSESMTNIRDQRIRWKSFQLDWMYLLLLSSFWRCSCEGKYLKKR